MLEKRSRLDSPALSGRLRKTARRSEYERRAVDFTRSSVISDIHRPVPVKRLVQPAQQHSLATPREAVLHSAPAKPAISPKRMMTADVRPVPKPKTVRPSSTVLHTRTTSSLVLKRQIANAPHAKALKQKGKRRIQLNARNLLTVIAIVIVFGGIWIGWRGFQVNKEVATKTATLGAAASSSDESTNDSSIPSETQAPDPASYKTTADRPRIITIDKINVHARVLRLGIKANNQLAAPSNIFDAGWYDESSKPGQAGAMVIDGHVSGPTKRGVFYDLKKLVAGDKITVERGDGKIFTYKVIKSVIYAADKVDMASVLTPVTPGKPGLNLITCSGEIDASRNHYKDRTVVYTEQI